MSLYAMMFPVLPGKEKEVESFITELERNKVNDQVDRFKRWGIRRERGFLQHTPNGSVVVVVAEVDNVSTLIREMKRLKTPFDKWFNERMAKFTGMTLDKIPDTPNELIYEWKGEHSTPDLPNVAFVVPIMKGKRGDIDRLADTLLNEKRNDFTEQQARLGIRRETCYVQKTPQGEYVIYAHQSDGVTEMTKRLSNSTEPFDQWMIEQVEQLHGIKRTDMPKWTEPKMLFDWDATVLGRKAA